VHRAAVVGSVVPGGLEVGTDIWCSPRHQTQFEPSFLEYMASDDVASTIGQVIGSTCSLNPEPSFFELPASHDVASTIHQSLPRSRPTSRRRRPSPR